MEIDGDVFGGYHISIALNKRCNENLTLQMAYPSIPGTVAPQHRSPLSSLAAQVPLPQYLLIISAVPTAAANA